MSKTPYETLRELMKGEQPILGFELAQLIESILNDDNDSYEYEVAEQIWRDYLSDYETVYKLAKFAYYILVPDKNCISYSCKRDLTLSPRGTEYFVPDSSATNEYDVADTLRTVVTNKQHIKGCDLKQLVDQTISHEKVESTEAFTNFSIQLAEYIKQYFIQDGNIRDDVWYVLRTKEYGTVIVLRDLKRSPRAVNTKTQKNTKKK